MSQYDASSASVSLTHAVVIVGELILLTHKSWQSIMQLRTAAAVPKGG